VEGAARSAGVRTGDSLVAYAGTGVPPNVSVLDIVQVRKGLDIVQVAGGWHRGTG
jgi:hypothetical protein